MRKQYLFTSESVTEGHPDKVCDQIADAILDEALKQDTMSRVACEVMAHAYGMLIAGEITSKAELDVEQIAREIMRDVGYDAKAGLDPDDYPISLAIHQQSQDIAQGVSIGYEKRMGLKDDAFSGGAGDQGLMFGYANSETDEYLPLPIYLAHRLSKQLTMVRKNGTAKSFLPDGKTQVTVAYEEDKPVHIDTVVVSTQHKKECSLDIVEEEIMQYVLKPILPQDLFDQQTKVLINPTGRFVLGGPMADTGLTGRKIIVDTYGGYARNGGGALSGKDPTKVDRSASYMARYLAKNIVAAGLAEKCEVQLAYAIGVAQPVSIFVDTFSTGIIPDEEIAELIQDHFDLRPEAIIHHLDLRRPIYRQTANYGHFGHKELNLPWEKLDQTALFASIKK